MQNYDSLIGGGYPKPFMVITSPGDGTYERHAHAGMARLHVSGALLIQGDDGNNVVYGPGRWETITYERQEAALPTLPRSI